MQSSLLDLLEVTKEELHPELTKYRLYCDMDGVLCDFREQYDHLFGMTPDQAKERFGRAGFWSRIHNHGSGFWATMPRTPSGLTLWNSIKQHNPKLLTAPPIDKSTGELDEPSKEGKASWAGKHLGISLSDIIFRVAEDKHLEAKKDVANGFIPILIDDKKSTIDSWNDAGGIGIYHPENTKSIDPILERLRKLYKEDGGESTKERV